MTPLKRLREERGLTQQVLAERVGVSQQSIARWEGGRNIPVKHLRDLAIALWCDVADLLGGDRRRLIASQQAAGGEDTVEGADELYGTFRIVFQPAPGGVPNVDADEGFDLELAREYPISVAEFNRVGYRLERRNDQASWLMFETLDNRMVFFNRSQVERADFISDDIEAAPPYDHTEVYAALSDEGLRETLEGLEPGEALDVFDAEEAPYSRLLIERCLSLAERVGGLEELLNRSSGVTTESIYGQRLNHWSHRDDDTYLEISVLSVELDSIWDRNNAPVRELFVEVAGEPYARSNRYRLGSLRLIEVPLLAYVDANRRALEETNEEERDGRSTSASEA